MTSSQNYIATEPFDYVIIGAGSAGCIVAEHLSKASNVRALLLEAGSDVAGLRMQLPVAATSLWDDARVNWGYASEPEANCGNRRLPVPRGKVVGGSSSINGMFYVRGHPSDYDGWAANGATGWGYDDVLPYFKQIESDWRGAGPFHGGSGPIKTVPCQTDRRISEPLMAAARACGYAISMDQNGAEPEGFGIPDLSIEGGRRASASRAFLGPALKRKQLRLEANAHVQRIRVESGRAVGVEYRKGGQLRFAPAAREVILCAGAINSPQLLMLSGIGPAADLNSLGIEVVRDLPGVGRNLQEHAGVGLDIVCAKPYAFDSELRADRFALSLLRWLAFGTGPLASMPVAGNAFIRTNHEMKRPDIQSIILTATPMSRIWIPKLRPPMGHVLGVRNILLHPESRGSVTLNSARPEDKPRIQFNFLESRNDLETLRRSIRLIRQVFTQPGLLELQAREVRPGAAAVSDDAIDAHIRRWLGTFCHPAGTCAMGRTASAVVDESLAVHGIDRLRVIDASVMPTLPGGNINAPTMMIAAKGAEIIQRNYL